MKIDYVQDNLISGVPNAYAHCQCSGADKDCEHCHGAGHIFLPFICVFGCGEAFLNEDEQDDHQMKVHGAPSMTEQ